MNAIDKYLAASDAYALARVEEMRIEDERPTAKHAAILRVMQGENPLTGKAHSASSAETQVEMDPGYREYLALRRQAVLATIQTRAACAVAYAQLTSHLEFQEQSA